MNTIDKINKFNYLFLVGAILVLITNMYDLFSIYTGLSVVYKLRAMSLVALIVIAVCVLFEVITSAVVAVKEHKVDKKQIVCFALLLASLAMVVCGIVAYFGNMPRYYLGNNKITLFSNLSLMLFAVYCLLKDLRNLDKRNRIEIYILLGFSGVFAVLSIIYIGAYNVFKFKMFSMFALFFTIQALCCAKDSVSRMACKLTYEIIAFIFFIGAGICAMLNYHVYDIVNSASITLTLAIGLYLVSCVTGIKNAKTKTAFVLKIVLTAFCLFMLFKRMYIDRFDLKTNCISSGIMLGVIALRVLSLVFSNANKFAFVSLGIACALLVVSAILERVGFDVLDLRYFYIVEVVTSALLYIPLFVYLGMNRKTQQPAMESTI